MINLTKEMDNDDGLDDFIICDSMDSYHIQKKQKYDHGSFGSKLSHLTEDEVLKQIGNYRRHLEKVQEGSPNTISKKRKPCRMSSIAI